MLSTAKKKLQDDLKTILKKSLYDAYMTTFLSSSDTEAVISEYIKIEIDKAAEAFSESAAESAAEPLATAIYDFVKQIGITAIPKGGLVAPPGGGPVTGVININEFSIS